jgi:phage terminase large subunit-like protein
MEQSFAAYFKSAWAVLNPGTQLVWGKHLDAMIDYLEAVRLGQITRLIINVPPKMTKSTLCSVCWPTWVWIRNPERRFAFYSWGADLSTTFSIQRRNLIQSDFYQSRWSGRYALSADENRTDVFSNTKTGRMTVLTSATGLGADALLLDDCMSVSEALSETSRATVINTIRQSLLTRVNSAVSSPIIILGQRLHYNDIYGELLRDGGWEHLNLSAEAQTAETITFPVSGKKWTRKKGDLLDPTLLPKEVLLRKERELGSWGYAGQFLLQPAPISGNIVDPMWWKVYKNHAEILSSLSQVIISVDTATKGTDLACDTAVQPWGVGSGGNIYFLARDTRKMNFTTTVSSIRAMAERFGTTALLVEDTSIGPAAMEVLRAEGFTCLPWTPKGDKVARLQAVSFHIQGGRVWIPDNQDGIYLSHVCAIAPGGPMDDVDAASQAISYLTSKGSYGQWVIDLGKKMEADPTYGQTSSPSTSDSNPYANKLPPEIRQVYADMREQLGMRPCVEQPADGRLPVPRKPSVSCPNCSSTKVLLAGISGKCRDCKTIFTPPALRKG